MREQLEARRAELEAEYAHGQQVLAELDQKRTDLAQTMLRISGAIQVLTELLTQPAAAEQGADDGGNH